MPAHFINKEGNNATQAFVNYALPLAGELPAIAALKGRKVPKKH
jgi:hypothetical protein